MDKVEVTKVIVSGKTVISDDKGNKVEIENPEIFLVKGLPKGA